MQKISGGNQVGEGTYWNLKSGRVVEMKDEGILPGEHNAVYYKVPFVLLFAWGILSGGLYIVFLPVTIIVMSFYLLGRRVFGGVFGQVRTSISFGWRPTEAYLAGKNRNRKDKKSNGK
ncbi:MAG: hypothetical protein HW377_296 [Actinobacteria bacterium]|nr:hypothetical protein [Actinomycetota bacterium]